MDFAAIVFDEAQKIKNPNALVTDASKAMKGEFVLAMTGTPVENRLADLWCVADRVQPGLLGDLKTFSGKYEADPSESTLLELKGRVWQDSAERNVPALMLRRMKHEKLDGLPSKTEHVVERVMPPAQAQAYYEAVSKARKGGHAKMLEALQAIRSLSLHPTPRAIESDEDFILASARLKSAFEILDRLAESKEKALIFLEFLDMQEILRLLIQRRYQLPAPPLLINGSVSGDRRKDRVDQFQQREGFDVMILSPKAGGVGLTLTAANHVLHLSRWWNPAVEDQCTDRVYRIGQVRAVNVYYLLALLPDSPEASFDRKLHDLITRKRHLSQQLLVPPAASEADAAALFDSVVGGS